MKHTELIEELKAVQRDIADFYKMNPDFSGEFSGTERRIEERLKLRENKIFRCVVAAKNSNGDPDLFFVKVKCSEEEFQNCRHYAAAEEAARNHGYEPHLSFDERDEAGKAMLPLFNWDSASVVNIDAVELE
jgi:hypothetical protein